MARITVEDCVKIIKNRFELVVLASRRARDIASGGEITVERNNDKDSVVALREIADKSISKEHLYNEVIASYQNTTKYISEEVVDKEVKESYEEESVDKDAASNADANGSDKVVDEQSFAEDNVEIYD